MSEKNNDKWLEKIISKTINSGKPQFDAEKFKQKFPDEYKILQSRASKKTGYPNLQPNIFRNLITKLAVAATIILVFGLFIIQLGKDEKVEIPKVTEIAQSPAEMLSTMSLTAAYRHGGIEAMEKQMDEAIEKLEPSPSKVTVKELLKGFNGS